jgi:serine/threonine-protein kinase HipA
MKIDVEIHHSGDWHSAARINIKNEALGFQGASTVEYDIDYWMNNAAVESTDDKIVFDQRAFSIADPVDLDDHYRKTWPPFLLDLMPQGHARRKLANHMKIDENARSSDLQLLLRAGSNAVGNVRIRQAVDDESKRLEQVTRQGVSEDEIFGRSERFTEIVDYFALLASGSSGLQGEWPKVAMTQATDGLYYPDVLVRDDEAIRHVIIKFLRSNSPQDEMILEGEAIYSKLAVQIGLNVSEPSRYAQGVLVIPRFDRRIAGDGTVIRLGQESFVSASNVAEFGFIGTHERYIGLIKNVSANPFEDVVEYMKREIANQALGNPDNHGRNTAFSKSADAGIRLSPLFDFAPMRLALEGVSRSTRWAAMLDRHSDHSPDWDEIVRVIYGEQEDAGRLLAEIKAFGTVLATAPKIAADLGAKPELIRRAMARCDEIVASLAKMD